MSPDVSPGSSPEAEPKLDSWKQIATYLAREVRTAQRWEKSEGLPVHRHQHGTRGTVFAYRSELDAWLQSRTGSPEPARLPGAGAATGGEAIRGRPGLSRLGRWLLLTPVVVAAIWFLGPRLTGGGATAGGSRLLVLPLSPIAGDALEETTGRALHEELITGLASLAPERLAVIGRTSALRYGSTGLGLAEIGDALGVEHVLEGSVRRREGELQVITRLVRAAEESELWSETFTLDMTDLAQGEEHVVRTVCAALARELLGIEPHSSRASSEDPGARAAWLRGRYLWHKGTPEGSLASLPHFEQALALDPDFVDAHVGLASAYNLLGRYGSMPAREVFPQGKAAALRALALDPDAAEAHLALAQVLFYYEWDFEAAAREFETALRLGSEIALTHHTYAHFLSCLGLHERGLESVRRARELEPLWPLVIADTAWFHYRARDYERGVLESRRALELEPGMGSALQCLVACLTRLGDERAAWAEMRAYLDGRGLLAEIPGIEGEEPGVALRNVRRWNRAEVERLPPERFVSAHTQAFSLTGLDRDDEVLHWLEVALETRDRVALLTLVHPAFDGLRDDPRFQSIVSRVGFPADPAALVPVQGVR